MEMGQIKSIPYSSSEILSVLEKKNRIWNSLWLGKWGKGVLCVYIFFCLFISSVRKPGAGFLHTAPLVMKYETESEWRRRVESSREKRKTHNAISLFMFFFLYSSEQEKENIEKNGSIHLGACWCGICRASRPNMHTWAWQHTHIAAYRSAEPPHRLFLPALSYAWPWIYVPLKSNKRAVAVLVAYLSSYYTLRTHDF